MKFEDAAEEYNRQYKLRAESWVKKTYYEIDFDKISDMILQAAKEEYPEFSAARIGYIWGEVYEQYHSSFGDCIWGMSSYCNFIKKLPA